MRRSRWATKLSPTRNGPAMILVGEAVRAARDAEPGICTIRRLMSAVVKKHDEFDAPSTQAITPLGPG